MLLTSVGKNGPLEFRRCALSSLTIPSQRESFTSALPDISQNSGRSTSHLAIVPGIVGGLLPGMFPEIDAEQSGCTSFETAAEDSSTESEASRLESDLGIGRFTFELGTFGSSS